MVSDFVSDEISGHAFGEAEAELELIASLPPEPCFVQPYKRAWALMFLITGTDIIYHRNVKDAPPIRIMTKAFRRNLMAKDMVGDIKVSDVNLLIDPTALLSNGLPWPPQQGDRVVFNKGANNESVYTAIEPPTPIDVAGTEIVVRMIARGL
jgi:hypothetical protein